MGVESQRLLSRTLDLGLVDKAKQIQWIDVQLIDLLHKTSFDFVEVVARGRTLLVGEGNLSFTRSLANSPNVITNKLVASTFEKTDDLLEETIANATVLRGMGATVLHGVDATSLSKTLGSWLFDAIVFQFPHAGSREAVGNHNPNFILVREFLQSAAAQLYSGGQVLISAVDTPHYRGAFQFEEAAVEAGFNPPEIYPFDPSAFVGYEHTMTHQTGSALDQHDAFSTWVFRR